jgi:two-component system sensor kinase FixL
LPWTAPAQPGEAADQPAARAAGQRLDRLQSAVLGMARVCAVGEMSATLAHQLNQPLTALMLYMQGLTGALEREAGAAGLSPQISSLLDRMAEEVERAADVVERMRTFMDRDATGLRPVALASLVDDAVQLTQMGVRPGVPVTRALAQDLPPVTVEPVQIRQALVGLLRHAMAAVKDQPQPCVRIQAAVESGTVALQVAHNGVAAPEATDLDVAVSRAIAENHGGDLTVDPGGQGRDPCLTLHLPLEPDPETRARARPEAGA